MPHVRSRQGLQVGIILGLAGLSAVMWYFNSSPPHSPELAVNTHERVVLDVVEVPGRVHATYAGVAIDVPGPPTRWLAVELHQGIASVGWATSPEEKPLTTVDLPDRGVRVIAYPLNRPAVAGVEVMPGLRSAPGRPTLRIVAVE